MTVFDASTPEALREEIIGFLITCADADRVRATHLSTRNEDERTHRDKLEFAASRVETIAASIRKQPLYKAPATEQRIELAHGI